MGASDLWEWFSSLSILLIMGIKAIAGAFFLALAAEFAKKLVNRDDEEPP